MSSSTTTLKAVPKRIQGRTVIASLPQKLAKRAVLAQTQHRRRATRDDRIEHAWKRRDYIEQRSARHQLTKKQILDARAWRREDLIKGPLAPKRDVGVKSGTFGALDVMQLYQSEKPTFKEWGVVEGDRVCVVKGREKGKIGVVKGVRKEAEEVLVEGVNMTDVAVPSYMLLKETDKTPVRAYEKPVPLSDVRLVAPLLDPETNKLRDHIIQSLTLRKVTFRERKGLDPPTRYITALSPPQYIPYPPKDTAEEEHEIDTLRIEVDEKTWVPTMRMPPMPPSVLDELRNKFSSFRFRHEGHYLAGKEKEARKELRRERRSEMMITPLKEARRRERRERKEMGRPELSRESLAEIGKVMQRNLKGTGTKKASA